MKQGRQNRIVSAVTRHHSVSVRTLSRELGVSEVTIRRDLQELEDKGVVRRAFGVAYAGDELNRHEHDEHGEIAGEAVFRPDYWLVRAAEPSAYRIYRPQAGLPDAAINGWNYATVGEIAVYLQLNHYRAGCDLGRCLVPKLPEGAAIGEPRPEVLAVTSDAEVFDDRIAGFLRGLDAAGLSSVRQHVVSHCQSSAVVADALKAYTAISILYSVDEAATLGLIEALSDPQVPKPLPPTAVFGLSDTRIMEAVEVENPFQPVAAIVVPADATAKRLLWCAHTLAAAGAETPEAQESLEYRVVSRTGRSEELILENATSGEGSDRQRGGKGGKGGKEREPSLSLAHVRDDSTEKGWTSSVEDALFQLSISGSTVVRSFDQAHVRSQQMEDARRSIARRALELVEPHKVMLVSDGEITTILAELLADSGIETTVITNSTRVFSRLASGSSIHLISTGGEFRPPYSGLVGWLAEAALRELRADNLFLEPATISTDYQLCCSNIAESPMLQAMIRAARRVTVLCDRFRFNGGAVTQIGPIDVATTLVTDVGTPATVRLGVRERGVEVIT